MMKAAAVAGLVGLTLWPAVASADPIRIVLDNRQAFSSTFVQDSTGQTADQQSAAAGDALRTSATSSTVLSNAAATGTLISSLDPGHFTGSGNAGISSDTAGAATVAAQALFQATFRLDQAYDFVFAGQFGATGIVPLREGQPNVSGSWRTVLEGGDGSTVIFDNTGDGGQSLLHTGQLAAGDWFLSVDAFANGFAPKPSIFSAASNYDFRLDLSVAPPPAPTPEPASLLLLATGVTGLLRKRAR
jgi:hypothetical protein